MRPTQPTNRQPTALPRWAAATGLALCLGALCQAPTASAQEFRLNIEPAAAIWLDKPQSERFTPGLYFAVRPGIALGEVVTLQLSYSLLHAPARDGFTQNGSAHSVSAGLRLRPFATLGSPDHQLGGLWTDINAGYVRTGDLDRLGLDVGLGYNWQASPAFAVGPVVRYTQVLQPDHLLNRDPNDAQFLSLGVNFSFGPAHKEPMAVVAPVIPAELVCPEAPECVQQAVLEPTPIAAGACPDQDGDGLCDAVDRCPDKSGHPGALGCPIDPCGGDPLLVLVQFPYDSAALPARVPGNPQTMDPVLEAIGDAIAGEPSCRVCIAGFASAEGGADYNMQLSRERASAVKGYLSARGLEESRMPTTGMGESCQLVPERNRPLNRRVEFYRLDEGQSCPTTCQ